MDFDENCAQESLQNATCAQANTKWRYALTRNMRVFCALLNNMPSGCLDAVILEKKSC